MGKKSRRKEQRGKITTEEKVNNSEVNVKNEEQKFLNTKHLVWQGIFVCLLAYGICLAFRLIELPAWSSPAFEFNGQYLMATHDAYTWLAGSKEISRRAGTALSEMIGFLHELTGFNLANIGFWLPTIFAPLASLPLALLAWNERQPEAGIVSGVMAAGCLGFFMRTRLGFVDTDIFALFFPLAIACSLIVWLSVLCRKNWLPTKDIETENSVNSFTFMLEALGIGLLIQGYDYFYGKIQVALALVGLAFLVGLVFTFKKYLRLLIFGFSLILVSGLGGWTGFFLGLVACAIFFYRPPAWQHWLYVGIFTGLALLLAGEDILNILMGAMDKILGYAKISSSEITSNSSFKLPSIQQSVREAQNLNWGAMASRTAGNWGLFCGGVLGFAYLIWRRPLFLIFLPLLGLGLASVKLGNRFSMYGGAALGLGLAFGVNQVFLDLKQKSIRRWLVQIVLCILVLWPLWKVSKNLSPAPILTEVYAKTFVDLKEKASKNAQLWQWWDYGYAGQYFAERRVFGDGGQHDGKYLYPLAQVHATSSLLQANQLMKFTLKSQMEQYRQMEKNGSLSHTKAKIINYPGDPVKELRNMSPQKAQAFVESLKTKKKDWPNNLPEQYFLVSWENLRLAYWISYYGTWDLVSGQANPGKIEQVQGQVQFNMEQGTMRLSRGQIRLNALDIIDSQNSRHLVWPNGSGIYAIMNRLSNELYIMDSKIYNSMMVQMLIAEPEKFNDHFELVVDHYPWNRAYRVK